MWLTAVIRKVGEMRWHHTITPDGTVDIQVFCMRRALNYASIPHLEVIAAQAEGWEVEPCQQNWCSIPRDCC